MRTETPKHKRKDKIVKFHILDDKKHEHLIAETSDNRKIYYMTQLKDDSVDRPGRGGTKPSEPIISHQDEIVNMAKNTNNKPDKIKETRPESLTGTNPVAHQALPNSIIPNKNTNFNKTKGINNKSDKTVNSTITDNLLKGLDSLLIKTMDESDNKNKGNNEKQIF